MENLFNSDKLKSADVKTQEVCIKFKGDVNILLENDLSSLINLSLNSYYNQHNLPKINKFQYLQKLSLVNLEAITTRKFVREPLNEEAIKPLVLEGLPLLKELTLLGNFNKNTIEQFNQSDDDIDGNKQKDYSFIFYPSMINNLPSLTKLTIGEVK